jgi:hypothetical protein
LEGCRPRARLYAAVHGIRRQAVGHIAVDARASDHHVRIVPKGSAIRSLIT